jgi:hypothetical protein
MKRNSLLYVRFLLGAWLGCAVVVFPTVGFAQTPPSPPPQGPLGQPVRGPEAPRTVPARKEPRISFWVRAEESWERNPEVSQEATADDLTSFVTHVAAGAGYTFRGRRGELGFLADVARLEYHSLPQLSRFTYGAGVNGTHRFSQRSSLSIRERYAESSYNPIELLATSGLPVSVVHARTNNADVALNLGLSSRTTLSLAARHQSITFGPEGKDQGLVDGSVVSFEPTLAQKVGRTNVLSAGYSFQKDLKNDSGTGDIQTAFLGWAGRLGHDYGAALSGGVSRVGATAGVEVKWRPYVSAALTADYRTGSLQARYTRTVSPAFGLGGDRLAELASLTAEKNFTRKVAANLNGSYGETRDIGDDAALRFNTVTAGAGLRYLVSRRFAFEWSYAYGSSDPEGSGRRIRTDRAAMAVTYGRNRE